MFWIGLIVGLVVGVIACWFGLMLFTMKITGMSVYEMADCGNLMIEAGQNRESTIVAYDSNGEQLCGVLLEENE